MCWLCYDIRMEALKAVRKKPGPAPRLNTDRTTLMLDPDLIEWGKQQPGGLSETVRRLLREAKVKAESSTSRW